MLPSLNEVLFFVVFLSFILAMLALDLGVFSRRTHKPSFREALIWTLVWVLISIGFYFLLRYYGNLLHGIDSLEAVRDRISRFHPSISLNRLPEDTARAIILYNHNLALEYLTGYLIEYSLSVDNVFVIIMIFLSFRVRPEYYKKVLLWGILGAVVMRFLFIFAASALILHFSWSLIFFGGMLIILGGKMGWEFFTANDEDVIDTENHPVVKFASRWFSVSPGNHGEKFFIRQKGKRMITPLFLVLLIIEFTDVLFAIDSVPAVFSVTHDPYIVFFSNIFAILGLRSLFFVLVNVLNRFTYLRLGLAVLLVFVGSKMILHKIGLWSLPTNYSLLIILGILLSSVIFSLMR
ncbi:MAG: TerC/Alx family metal homeostasis membrane protein, partial [Bacteroidales bacterium]|nr:TerC/Alx family metal homeostasis membrane protein [Bacteroidales bacterium]